MPKIYQDTKGNLTIVFHQMGTPGITLVHHRPEQLKEETGCARFSRVHVSASGDHTHVIYSESAPVELEGTEYVLIKKAEDVWKRLIGKDQKG